jgi:hypothetical protein
MKPIRHSLIAVLAVASLFLHGGCSRRTADRPQSTAARGPVIAAQPQPTAVPEPKVVERSTPGGPPKSLIVVAGTSGAYARGIQQLLERHRVATTIVSASKATRKKAAGFDLIIVVGKGSYAARLPDFDQPVLGFGCCGCAYFGTLRLKNGEPWT